jgi:hypothetical protein
MVMSLEVIELKKKLLDLLREDEEFRLAIAGLLGYSEILKRLDRHEEELKKLREDFLIFIKEQERRWEETYKRLDRHEEEFRRIWESIERLRQDFLTFVKEQEKRWEENNKRWEENNKRWEEAYKRFEAVENELKRLREDFNTFSTRIERRMNSFERKLIALGRRWGVESEEAFRDAMEGIIEELFGVGEVRRWVYYDEGGEVLGHPSQVEVDLLIRDKVHVLVEVKASTSDADISKLWKIGKLYERVVGVKPRLVVITPFIDERGLKTAKELGVEVYTDV